MKSAVSKISGALDFTTLLSRNQLTQSRSFNLFYAVNYFQERSLSQFHQRELFNPNNKRADNDRELNKRALHHEQNERSIQNNIDNEKHYQSERAVFNNHKDNVNKQGFGEKEQTIVRSFGFDRTESQLGSRDESSSERRPVNDAARVKYAHVFYQSLLNK